MDEKYEQKLVSDDIEDGTSVQRSIAGAIYTETDKRNTGLDGI